MKRLSFALATSDSSPSSVEPRGLLELGERVASGAPGVVVVEGPDGGTLALLEHLARVVERAGLVACVGAGGAGAPAFHLVARGLRLARVPEPRALAEAVRTACVSRRAVVLCPMPARGSWDAAIVAHWLEAEASALVVLVGEGQVALAGAETYIVSEALDDDERRHFLVSAVEREAHRAEARHVGSLAAIAARIAGDVAALPPDAAELLAALLLAARPWPIRFLARLGAAEGALDALVSSGRAIVRDEAVYVVTTAEATLASPRAADVAAALLGTFVGDGWASARAAELLLASDPERADALHVSSLDALTDPLARRELRRRWLRRAASSRALLLRAATRALDVGEHEEVLRVLEGAPHRAEDEVERTLLVGRALVGTGDTVGARVAFERARATDVEGAHADAIAVELAEVAYAQGRLDEARTEASKIDSARTRLALHASNVLGKIALSRASWDEADAHFARDAMTARARGYVLEELRARLNRAIAVLSKGFVEEASAMLSAVLADSEANGYDLGAAYALTNLASTAWDRRDYGRSLACLERAFEYHRALGSAAMVAQTTSSLADVRLRLGLVDQAAQSIGFGRRSGLAPFRAAKFAFVATRIALVRGDLSRARREMDHALLEATASADVESLGEAHEIAARVHLAEGDVAAAKEHLALAERHTTTERGRAAVALVAALVDRAAGRCSTERIEAAVRAGRSSGDDAVHFEALALLARHELDSGDAAASRLACERAVAVRASVAEGLPPVVRAAFLARAESRDLDSLHAALAADVAQEDVKAAPESSPRTERAPRVGGAAAAAAFREIVGEDAQIRALLASIRRVAASDATVLVRGESGTGKELVASALHRASPRAHGPLVSVNCAALVESLLLSELFGHEKGAFTGATARRPGRFELAEGGTLFLDEIGDISPRTQVALLRVLQEKTYERVGGTSAVVADVRVVCATHRDLRAMVDRGEFREDLYYRLRGIQLDVPSLRARPGDIPLLAAAILARIAQERGEGVKRLSAEAVDVLRAHRWPGNVRELENALRAASLFADGDVIGPADLLDNVEGLKAAASAPPSERTVAPPSRRYVAPPQRIAPAPQLDAPRSTRDPAAIDDDEDGALPLSEAGATAFVYDQIRRGEATLSDMKRQIERDCIARALTETRGNITKAAALLGMKRPRLSQLVKQYGLTASEGV